MRNLYRWFPLSSSVQPGVTGSLIVSLIIYLAACAVLGLLEKILGWIPLAGWLVSVACSLLGLYGVVGMVLSVLRFLQR